MKKLYILTSNAGDGSYSLQFTFDENLVNAIAKAVEEGKSFACEQYSDGDGFHPTEINVPEDSSPLSLGIQLLDETDLEDLLD